MTDEMPRNLQLVRDAIEKAKIHYYSTPDKLIVYWPCHVDLQHRALRPTSIRLTIAPDGTGILFQAALPVPLPSSNAEERRIILRQIAKLNYNSIRGGLTWQPDSERLTYRALYEFGEDAICFDEDEVVTCVNLSGASLSVGFETIVNALDEAEADDGSEAPGDAADPDDIRPRLDSLFDQLFSTPAEADAPDPDAADDGPASADASADPDLRSMLETFLSDAADSE